MIYLYYWLKWKKQFWKIKCQYRCIWLGGEVEEAAQDGSEESCYSKRIDPSEYVALASGSLWSFQDPSSTHPQAVDWRVSTVKGNLDVCISYYAPATLTPVILRQASCIKEGRTSRNQQVLKTSVHNTKKLIFCPIYGRDSIFIIIKQNVRHVFWNHHLSNRYEECIEGALVEKWKYIIQISILIQF